MNYSNQHISAGLVFGLALFIIGCAGTNNNNPVWNTPYKPSKRQTSERIIYAKENLDTVYSIVENEANYPGGNSAWMKHVKEKLNYPIEAKKKDIFGNVVLGFIVTKEGKIANISVLRSLGFGCDQEAIRLLITSGKWNPAEQNGAPVNARSNVRIVF